MAINAISGLSIYEYYYSINKKEKKKESPLANEMEKYGLTPTDNKARNIQLLQQARALAKTQEENKETISYSDRPWADLMYQLNIEFNEDPKDDIEDIKEELAKLTNGISDKELDKEISDLINYVDSLYISFSDNRNTSISDTSYSLVNQLNNMALMNTSYLS